MDDLQFTEVWGGDIYGCWFVAGIRADGATAQRIDWAVRAQKDNALLSGSRVKATARDVQEMREVWKWTFEMNSLLEN